MCNVCRKTMENNKIGESNERCRANEIVASHISAYHCETHLLGVIIRQQHTRACKPDRRTDRPTVNRRKEINEHHQYQQQWQRRREKTKNWHHAVGDNAPRDIVVTRELWTSLWCDYADADVTPSRPVNSVRMHNFFTSFCPFPPSAVVTRKFVWTNKNVLTINNDRTNESNNGPEIYRLV